MVDSQPNIILEMEKKEKKNILKLLMMIGIPFLIYFISKNLFVGRFLSAFLMAPMLILMSLGVPVLLKRIDKDEDTGFLYKLLFYAFFLFFGIIIIYLIGLEGNFSRLPWFYIFPLLAFLILGYKSGFVFTAIVFIATFFLSFISPNVESIVIEDMRFRFFVSIIIIMIISFVMERWRGQYKEQLIQSHYKLLQSEYKIKKNIEKLQLSEEKYRNLVNTMHEGLVGVDANWNMNFVNDRFTNIIGYSKDQLIGKSFFKLISNETRQIAEKQHELRKNGENSLYELELIPSDKKKIYVLCSPNPSYDGDGNYLGGFGVISDITDRKSFELERERLISELQEALENIKTLQGLIPICSSCKKIRNDQGYWDILESYLQRHSNAQFSHSICPECSDKLYGNEDWYKKVKRRKNDQ